MLPNILNHIVLRNCGLVGDWGEYKLNSDFKFELARRPSLSQIRAMASSFTREEAASKLAQLRELILGLPSSLVLNASDSACFCLDESDVEDIGWAGALNRCFEINWGHRINGIKILERGSKLSCTVAITEAVIPVAEDVGLVVLWLDTLLDAVRKAGQVVIPVDKCEDNTNNFPLNPFSGSLAATQPAPSVSDASQIDASAAPQSATSRSRSPGL